MAWPVTGFDQILLGVVAVFSLIAGVILVRFIFKKSTPPTPTKPGKKQPNKKESSGAPASKPAAPKKPANNLGKTPAPTGKTPAIDLGKTPLPKNAPQKPVEPAKKSIVETSRSIAVPEPAKAVPTANPPKSVNKSTPPQKPTPAPEDDGFEVISHKRGAKKSVPELSGSATRNISSAVPPTSSSNSDSDVSKAQAKKVRRAQELADREAQQKREAEELKRQEAEKQAQQKSLEEKKAAELAKLVASNDAKPQHQVREQITQLSTQLERRVREAERLREVHLQKKRALKAEERALAATEQRYNDLVERQKLALASQKQDEEPKSVGNVVSVDSSELVIPKIDLQGSLENIARLKQELRAKKENLSSLHSRLGNSVVLSI